MIQPVRVSELGEFGLIEAVASLIGRRQNRGRWPDLLLGAGEDDAAAWRARAGIKVATTDTLTQDVDFLPGVSSWPDLGWKALAINLSDIAGMGALPSYCLVTLGLPPDTEVEAVLGFYRGLLDLAERFHVAVAGGDMGLAREISLTVALWGEAREEPRPGEVPLLQRSGARPGDLVAVTGYFGASAAGLRVLRSALALPAEVEAPLRQAHLRPWPRVDEGGALLRAGVRAAIDVSDGLVADLEKLCRRSRVGARLWVDRVPVHPAVRQAFPEEALRLALSGGEDFELLFAGPVAAVERARRLTSTPITVVGEIVEGTGEVSLLGPGGEPFPLAERGWDHFGHP